MFSLDLAYEAPVALVSHLISAARHTQRSRNLWLIPRISTPQFNWAVLKTILICQTDFRLALFSTCRWNNVK